MNGMTGRWHVVADSWRVQCRRPALWGLSLWLGLVALSSVIGCQSRVTHAPPGSASPPTGANPAPTGELLGTPPSSATAPVVFKMGDRVVTPVGMKRITLAPVDAPTGHPADRVKLVDCAGAPCPARGDPAAPLTLIEFTDYACDHCRDFILETVPLIEQQFVATGKARWVSHPIAGIGRAEIVTTAALCAARQGKYFEFQRLVHEKGIMEPSGNVLDAIRVIGQQVGIDTDELLACIGSPDMLGKARAISDEAVLLGIRYTPALLVGDTLLEGAWETQTVLKRIQRAVDRQSAGGTPTH